MHPFRILFLIVLVVLPLMGEAQELSNRTAAFYNVENLFDPENDPASDDGDFTPDGIYRWIEERFREKIGRIARVLAEIRADIVGLAEVENRRVVDSLAAHPAVSGLRYDCVHFDSPDPRGIDVALLYRRGVFRLESMQAVRYSRLPQYRTRELLHVSGQWRGYPTHILVCHLPSVTSSKSVRNAAAESVRQYVDSLLQADPDYLIILMGDFNANPGDHTMKLLTRNEILINPFRALYRQGLGTYNYRSRWNMYDSILVGGTLPAAPVAKVFIRDWLIQPDGSYQGYPFRSFSGTEYIGGYSDHLPVLLTLPGSPF